MQPSVRIRRATPDDARVIAAILREAFAEFAPGYTPEAFAVTTPDAAKIRERFANSAIWVALQDTEIIGTVSAIVEEERLYIRSMAVVRTAQGAGVGRKLLAEVENYARQKGLRRLFLYTTPFLLGALRLYEQSGFERGAVATDGFFGTPFLAMEKRLSEA